jgi:hypothetical protein
LHDYVKRIARTVILAREYIGKWMQIQFFFVFLWMIKRRQYKFYTVPSVMYDVRFVLLLMGNNDADMLGGIFVRFSDGTKSAWVDLLRDVHNLLLKWAYSNQLPNGKPSFEEQSFLDPVLSKIKIQAEQEGWTARFSFLSAMGGGTMVWLPLPESITSSSHHPNSSIQYCCLEFIQRWIGYANQIDLECRLYSANSWHPGACCSANAAVVHQLHHMATSNENLNSYQSLRHYRNATNKRISFHELMLSLSRLYGKQQHRVQIPDLPVNNGILTTRV